MIKIRNSLFDRQKKEERSELLDLVFFALVLIFCVFIVWARFYWLWCMQVEGDSMFDTLKSQDYVLVNKLSRYSRGDVIVFTTDEFLTEQDKANGITVKSYIKRLIAIEGDELKVENGEIWRKKSGENKFEKLIEPYASGETILRGYPYLSENGDRITVPIGYVFVMGDNRSVSYDSRAFGCVKIEYIDGVVSQGVIDNKDGLLGKLYKFI